MRAVMAILLMGSLTAGGCKALSEVLLAAGKSSKHADEAVEFGMRHGDQAVDLSRGAGKSARRAGKSVEGEGWAALRDELGAHVRDELADAAFQHALNEVLAPGLDGTWEYREDGGQGGSVTGLVSRRHLGGGVYSYSGTMNVTSNANGKQGQMLFQYSGAEVFGESQMCDWIRSVEIAEVRVLDADGVHDLTNTAAVRASMPSGAELRRKANAEPCKPLVRRDEWTLVYGEGSDQIREERVPAPH